MKKFGIFFFDGDKNDMFADMNLVSLIEAPTEASASNEAFKIMQVNPKLKSYGIYEYSDEVLNMKCHCAIDEKDSYMPFRDAFNWFNQMLFEGNTRIRVWIMYEPENDTDEPEEDLVMYSGGLPF